MMKNIHQFERFRLGICDCLAGPWEDINERDLRAIEVWLPLLVLVIVEHLFVMWSIPTESHDSSFDFISFIEVVQAMVVAFKHSM